MQCVIYAGVHKSENHKCGVTDCAAKWGKICVHVVPKCANCGGNHQVTAFKCPARQKAQADAWKGNVKKAHNREEKQLITKKANEDMQATPKLIEMELDTDTNWAKSPEAPTSDLSSVGDNEPEDIQDSW